MDFSIFDHAHHMTALTWLGRKNWMVYKDLPHIRSISAKPRKMVFLKGRQPAPPPIPEAPIVVGEKEFNRHPQEMWQVLKEIVNVLEYDVVGTFWYNTLAKALSGGPKIFRPTHEQCEALQHAEARYSFKDYKQPFPVITLEIPDTYREQLKQQYGIQESPQFVLVHHDDANNFIAVSAFINKGNIITHVTPDRPEYETIEMSLVKNRDRRKDEISIEGNNGEFDAAENVQRLGINFAMMMSLYTVKVAGPLDPSNYKIWEQESQGKQKTGEFTRNAVAAQQKLAAAMHLVEFDQQVSFYDEIEEQIEVGLGVDIEKLHKSPKSHWRRGHFVMQPYGIGRRERKMIFRKPLLVRAKYFLGDIKDASATYTIHPGRVNPPLPSGHTPTDLPPPEPKVQVGQRIQIVYIEESPFPPGTQGVVKKITPLGSEIVKIDAITDDDQKFTLLVPPDEYSFL